MSESVTVLIAEDDDGHATLMRRNLRRASIPAAAVHLRDGQELLDYLYRQGPWHARPDHDALMILLDLNMPRLGGLEVLERLKQDTQLAHIPIFVLTTTDNPLELDRCYARGASACLIKPLDYGSFGDMVHRLAEFLVMARLPAEIPHTPPHAH